MSALKPAAVEIGRFEVLVLSPGDGYIYGGGSGDLHQTEPRLIAGIADLHGVAPGRVRVRQSVTPLVDGTVRRGYNITP